MAPSELNITDRKTGGANGFPVPTDVEKKKDGGSAKMHIGCERARIRVKLDRRIFMIASRETAPFQSRALSPTFGRPRKGKCVEK